MKYTGLIESIRPESVTGWCNHPGPPGKPVELELYINNAKKARTRTKAPIQAAQANDPGQHFVFILNPHIDITRSSVLVKPAGSDYKLPFSDTIKQNYLMPEPKPLIFPDKKLALLWSAKSGCTYAIKWFFYQMNLLDDALSFDKWIHHYRQQVYNQSRGYRENINDLIDSMEYRVLKVVRNPYARAVSSYMHAINTGYADSALSLYLGRTVKVDTASFSFREFIDFLGTLDLALADIHHRLQKHHLERLSLIPKPDIIRLEDIQDELKLIEMKYKLKQADHQSLRLSEHHTAYCNYQSFSGDRFIDRFSDSIPEYRYFYDDSITRKVADLYKEDFDAYGYPVET